MKYIQIATAIYEISRCIRSVNAVIETFGSCCMANVMQSYFMIAFLKLTMYNT